MNGPTKNLTILTCERMSLFEDFQMRLESSKIAKHPGTMTNVLAGTCAGDENVYFFDLSSKLKIICEFLHSEDGPQGFNFTIKSFHIIEGDWRAILILSDGRIYRASIDEFGIEGQLWTFEQVGAVEGGISAAEWSPDSTILVLITGLNRRILLTRDFELLDEGAIQVESYGSEEMISIGWGKKETQFHGTLGKSAAIAVAPIKMEPVIGDDRQGRISWRADGSYFALSSVDEGSGRRIRVYDRSGSLISTSEPIEGLEGPLAWRPNGSVIGAVQFLSAQKKRQVVFFERNGLRHGEFVLPEGHSRPVLDLSWSSDSNVLAIVYEGDEIELWSSANYHWYLKKRLPGGSDERIKNLVWDPERVVLSSITQSYLNVFTLVWDQDVSESCIAVIDGKSVHLTPMNICNIPPPMSLVQLNLSSVPDSISLTYLPFKKTCVLAVALPGQVEIYSIEFSTKRSECKISSPETFPLTDRLIQIKTASLNEFTASNILGDRVFTIQSSGITETSNENAARIYRVLPNSRLISQDSALYRVSNERELVFESSNNVKGEWIECLNEECTSILTMNEKGMLWLDEKLIMTQATSFSVCQQFVMVTTHSHQLIFLPRNSPHLWESLARSALEGHSGNEETQRRVERGALLVTSVVENSSVILQMPRGNLETICPRAMVLSSLRQNLNSLEYRAAYALCRRHRIDLNIIHDNSPEMFMQTISKFVNDLESADHLNIFLSSLRDEDVSKTKYSGFNSAIAVTSKDNSAYPRKKINSVSEAILKVLRVDPLKWIDSIITVYVVQEPPRLEEALNCIIDLSKEGESSPDLIEKSLKYLLFLVPADKLFDVALGMYQLPLALSIGRRSQKDPKDFEPFLEHLVKLSEIERQYQINDHLQRYPQALKCLYENESVKSEVFLEYMKKYQLYKEAVVISSVPLQCRDHLYGCVINGFGDYLALKGDHFSAVCLFKRSKNWSKVLQSSIHSGSWVEFLEAASQIPEECNETMKLSLVSTLKTQNRLGEALQFSKSCGLSNEFIFKLALEGALFSEAAHLVKDFNYEELTVALEEHSRRLLERIQELTIDVTGKAERMLRVQRAFITTTPTFVNLDAPQSSDFSDNVSEMSFRTSNTTIKTRTTNTSKRSTTSTKKTERNRTRDRPGSPHEREFLLFNLRELIGQTARLAPQVHETLKNLTKFSSDGALSLPRSINQSYVELCKLLQEFVVEFGKIQVRPLTCFNCNGQVIDDAGNVIENPLSDPLEAKFDLPVDFGNPSSWSLGLFT